MHSYKIFNWTLFDSLIQMFITNDSFETTYVCEIILHIFFFLIDLHNFCVIKAEKGAEKYCPKIAGSVKKAQAAV